MVMDHTAMMQAGVGLPTLAEDTIPQQGGQAAFSAIGEIVARLVADPATDWTKVDVEALRQHLIDMDNVILHAEVATTEIEGGRASTQARLTRWFRPRSGGWHWHMWPR